MNYQTIYGFDCGTTNWRIYGVTLRQQNEAWQLQSAPYLVELQTFERYLPAAILLAESGGVACYGEAAYEAAQEPEQRPYLRDRFKPSIGQRSSDFGRTQQSYSSAEALQYTGLLLQAVMNQFAREKPTCFNEQHQFYFTHPVHWGRQRLAENPSEGVIEGEILRQFAEVVRGCFPATMQPQIHFVPEPEAALLSLLQLGQLRYHGDTYTLIMDVGGGTTDFVAGQLTTSGELQRLTHYGEPHGGGLFDSDLARYLAELLKLTPADTTHAWSELCFYGKDLKEKLSRQTVQQTSQVNKRVVFETADGNTVVEKVQFSQADFERYTLKTSTDFGKLMAWALYEMNLRPRDIGQVLLVGGGANLYLVPQMLRKIFGDQVPVIFSDPPEETVVRGAVLCPLRHSLAQPLAEAHRQVAEQRQQAEEAERHRLAEEMALQLEAEKERLAAEMRQQVEAERQRLAREAEKQRQEAEQQSKIKRRRTKIEFDWVEIPAGAFWMGTDLKQDKVAAGSDWAKEHEQPQHEVYLADYLMARTPVTNAQWEQFLKDSGYDWQGIGESDKFGWQGKKTAPRGREQHPVVYVTSADAWAFCEWAGVRLPSEAEWEKAARGPDKRLYPWGNQAPTVSLANYGCNIGDTTPVGQYPEGKSYYGLLDMAGNVWEWTRTVWGSSSDSQFKYPYKAGDGRELDTYKNVYFAIRGGSWDNFPVTLRCAFRDGNDYSWYFNLGFRVLRPPV